MRVNEENGLRSPLEGRVVDAVEWADEKVNKLDTVDLGLLKWSCLVGGVLLAKWIPGLRKVNSVALVAIMLGFAAKPLWDAYGDD